MVVIQLALWLLLGPLAFADGAMKPPCGDFLRRYVLHRENAYLILPLANGDADTSKRLVLKSGADVRRHLEANPDEPWQAELEKLPTGYFREHVVLRTEIGPTGWKPDELSGYLELVNSRIAADPVRARTAIQAMAAGESVPHFTGEAHARVLGSTLDLHDDRGVLWLARALMRESLIRHKLAVVDGELKRLGQILSDEDVYFFAAFPELAAFWPWRHVWQLKLPDPTLSAPTSLFLPPVHASIYGTCDLEVSRDNWTGARENVELRLHLKSRCSEESRSIERWYRARWSDYLDLLAQKTRGETPEPERHGSAWEVEFDPRSVPRGLGFYVFLSQRPR